jgi:hypothetical protein
LAHQSPAATARTVTHLQEETQSKEMQRGQLFLCVVQHFLCSTKKGPVFVVASLGYVSLLSYQRHC